MSRSYNYSKIGTLYVSKKKGLWGFELVLRNELKMSKFKYSKEFLAKSAGESTAKFYGVELKEERKQTGPRPEIKRRDTYAFP